MSLIENKKAHFNYEILEKLEAGLELLGLEVKSIRNKHGSLEGSHVGVRGNEVFLIGANIPPYQPGNTPKNYDPYRSRKLLLTKAEIKNLLGKEKTKGLTIVPLSVYNKGAKIKISIGVARGKKKYDKRESVKKRELDRDIRRTLKNE
ncbi:MAG: SsrA-binding protein SmpB [bacterium]|nr:SsrA-binding protein SmpB [bacterium]